MCIFVAANTDVWCCKFEHCGDNFAFVDAEMGEGFAVTESPAEWKLPPISAASKNVSNLPELLRWPVH